MAFRLVGSHLLLSGTTLWARLVDFPAPDWDVIEITSVDAYFYNSNDGDNDDLIFVTAEGIAAATGVKNYLSLTLNNSTGAITWANSHSTKGLVVSFEDPHSTGLYPDGDALKEMLYSGLSADTFTIPRSGTVVTPAFHFDFYPIRLMLSDLRSEIPRGAQSILPHGRVRTSYSAHRQERNLVFRLANAYPRATVDNEYKQFLRWLRHAAQGKDFRFYPDTTVFSIYNEATQPWGYSKLVAKTASCSFEPQLEFGNRINAFKHTLKCFIQP